MVVLPCPPSGNGGTLSPEQKKIFDKTIEEIKSFGEGSEALVKEVEDISKGDADGVKKWLDAYTPDLAEEEEKLFTDSVATLKTKEERDAENERWKGLSNAGKRYYLKFLGLASAVPMPGAAPATVVVTLPAGATLTVDKRPTSSTGPRRTFQSPALEPNKTFFYTLAATYTEKGAPVVVTRKVKIRAGETTEVTFEPAKTIAVAARKPSAPVPLPIAEQGRSNRRRAARWFVPSGHPPGTRLAFGAVGGVVRRERSMRAGGTAKVPAWRARAGKTPKEGMGFRTITIP